MIEHMNIIDSLASQIAAILDLMQTTNGNTDSESINMAAEMCMTMQVELMAEVDKIMNEWRDGTLEPPHYVEAKTND